MLALDKQQMRMAFDHAADHYDEHAWLQQEIADRLLQRLDFIKIEPSRILDIGCGTGYCARPLQQRYKKAEYIGIDISTSMLRIAARQKPGWFRKQRWLCADAETLPLCDQSVDLVISNLSLQWCDPIQVFRQCLRVLRPEGLLMFTSFGPDTLMELRQAWLQVDTQPHVHDFIDMHDLGDVLLHQGFADPVLDVERLRLTYKDIKGLLYELKNIGAHNVATERNHGLTGKQRFQKFTEAYENAFTKDGRLSATYEVVYGHAWMLPKTEQGRQQVFINELEGL